MNEDSTFCEKINPSAYKPLLLEVTVICTVFPVHIAQGSVNKKEVQTGYCVDN